MKKLYTTISILFLAVFLNSCQKELTLQKYLVESQSKDNFTTLDFSTNTLPFDLKEDVSEEDLKAFKSVKKVNIAFLAKSDASEEELTTEKNKLRSIFKDSEYKTLMKFNDKRGRGTIYYLGETTDDIKEIVGVVEAEKFGVGIARLLGEKMDPSAIMKMVNSSKIDQDNAGLKSIATMFDKKSRSK